MMNFMCYLTQFTVSCIITDTQAESFSKIFMEQVIQHFRMVLIVVVDVDNRFKSIFEAMCKILKLVLFPLSRRNHKGNGAEHYHRVLHKNQTISGKNTGTHEVFHQNVKTSQYSWNSAPVDDTCIPL